MNDIEYAAEKLRRGVERATVSDKYDKRVSDPETQKKYASGFAKFIGHPVPKTAEMYGQSMMDAVQTSAWNRKPTDVHKWIEAMKKIQ
jgi:hypothetical protein